MEWGDTDGGLGVAKSVARLYEAELCEREASKNVQI